MSGKNDTKIRVYRERSMTHLKGKALHAKANPKAWEGLHKEENLQFHYQKKLL